MIFTIMQYVFQKKRFLFHTHLQLHVNRKIYYTMTSVSTCTLLEHFEIKSTSPQGKINKKIKYVRVCLNL